MVQQFALDHPERVRSLTLVGTSAGIAPELRPRYEKRLAEIECGGLAAFVDQQMALTLSPHFLETRPDGAAWYRQQYLANNPDSYSGAMRAMLEPSFQDRLCELRCPTLILCGGEDTALVTGGPRRLEGVYELHRLIPHSELVIVPGSNHYVQLERPEVFVATVRGFLARVEASRA